VFIVIAKNSEKKVQKDFLAKVTEKEIVIVFRQNSALRLSVYLMRVSAIIKSLKKPA